MIVNGSNDARSFAHLPKHKQANYTIVHLHYKFNTSSFFLPRKCNCNKKNIFNSANCTAIISDIVSPLGDQVVNVTSTACVTEVIILAAALTQEDIQTAQHGSGKCATFAF